MNDLKWITIECIKKGIKRKVLVDKLNGYDYNTFTRILNGFQKAPKDFIEKVKKALKEF